MSVLAIGLWLRRGSGEAEKELDEAVDDDDEEEEEEEEVEEVEGEEEEDAENAEDGKEAEEGESSGFMTSQYVAGCAIFIV